MKIGENIIYLRERKGWTQRELAKKVGLNTSVMNRIESGERPVKDEEIIKLATALETTPDYLLGYSAELIKQQKEIAAFVNDPSLQEWYKDLPYAKEHDLQKLRKIWDILKEDLD